MESFLASLDDEELITSVITYEEYGVGAYRKSPQMIAAFDDFASNMGIEIIPIGRDIARKAAEIRSKLDGFKFLLIDNMQEQVMTDRAFAEITTEEIQERKKMYEEADRLGIDLMSFDDNNDSSKRKDVVDAIVLLGTGKEVPADLEKRLLERKVTA